MTKVGDGMYGSRNILRLVWFNRNGVLLGIPPFAAIGVVYFKRRGDMPPFVGLKRYWRKHKTGWFWRLA